MDNRKSYKTGINEKFTYTNKINDLVFDRANMINATAE